MSLTEWLVPIVHAASSAAPVITPVGAPVISQNPTDTITNIATNIRAILLLLAGVLAAIYLIWSGIQYVTSAGDPAKTKIARAGIVNAVIGIIVIVATIAIIRFAVGIGKCAAGSATSTNACNVQATQTSTTNSSTSGRPWWDLFGGTTGTDTSNSGTTNNLCADGSQPLPDGSCPTGTSSSSGSNTNPCTDPNSQDCTLP